MKTSQVVYEGNLRTNCTHLRSGQKIITDAPVDNMGKGEAFSPTDLTATSLAACLITTIAIAADKKSMKIEAMDADATKIMAAEPRRISEMVVEVRIKAPSFSAEDKSYIEHIGNNCPVAKSLHPDINQNITYSWS
jgi:putative redox protein